MHIDGFKFHPVCISKTPYVFTDAALASPSTRDVPAQAQIVEQLGECQDLFYAFACDFLPGGNISLYELGEDSVTTISRQGIHQDI